MRLELARYAGDSMARTRARQPAQGRHPLARGRHASRLAGGHHVEGPMRASSLRSFSRHAAIGSTSRASSVQRQAHPDPARRSASMLDETLVNILRMRNMPEVQKMLARRSGSAPWRTVDWLTTQFPPDSKFQIYAFNTQAHAGCSQGSDRQVARRPTIRASLDATVAGAAGAPRRRTARASINAFDAAAAFNPAARPDPPRHRRPADAGRQAPALRKAVTRNSASSCSTRRSRRCPPTCR